MKVVLVRAVIDSFMAFMVYPPLGLGYLATALRKHNHEVELVDSPKRQLDFEGFRKLIKETECDAIGFQMMSLEFANVKKCIQICKEEKPNSTIIVGGAHPSCASNEVLNQVKEANFAFKGEAEIGFPMLINALESKRELKKNFEKIPGLIWRNNGKIMINQQVFTEDLDSLGFPAWDLMPPNEYPRAPHGGFSKGGFPVAPIIISRGCPFNCGFCAAHEITGRRIRYRSIDHVIKEIKFLKEKHGVKEIHIEDDNFTLRRDKVVEFCNKIMQERINLPWYCAGGTRIDTLDKELLELMKKSGCYTVMVAIESGVQKTLDSMNKQLKIETIEKTVKMIREAGLEATALFILGYPGETLEDMEKTIDFALKLAIQRAHFSNFLPLPGCEAFEMLKKSGELKDFDYSKLHSASATVPYAPKGISKKKLKELQKKAFWKFYLRPKIILHNAVKVNSLSNLKFILKRAKEYLFRA